MGAKETGAGRGKIMTSKLLAGIGCDTFCQPLAKLSGCLHFQASRLETVKFQWDEWIATRKWAIFAAIADRPETVFTNPLWVDHYWKMWVWFVFDPRYPHLSSMLCELSAMPWKPSLWLWLRIQAWIPFKQLLISSLVKWPKEIQGLVWIAWILESMVGRNVFLDSVGCRWMNVLGEKNTWFIFTKQYLLT